MTEKHLLLDRVTRVPREPYKRSAPKRSDALLLDGNEGCSPDGKLLDGLATAGSDILRRYPSVDRVADLLARRFGISADRVVVTGGADDALDRVCRTFLERGCSAVVPVPTFEMLRRFVRVAGGETIEVAWASDFPCDGVIGAVRPDTTLIAIVSPNNPTGGTISREEFMRIASDSSDKVILLDHAYVEYANDDLTDVALTFPNVIVVRTLSKAWGLAGCRVGYALAAAEVAALIRNAGNPYPVSGPSLEIAAAQLEDGSAALESHVNAVRERRAIVAAQLETNGIAVPPSEGNFVFPAFGAKVEFVYQGLQSAGVVTRWFSDRPEIANGLRISLPDSAAGLARLTEALDLVLQPQAILLDLDGVIADVRQSYRQCVIRVAGSYGIAVSPDDIQAEKRAGNANSDWELARRLMAGRGLEVALDEVIERYQALYLGSQSQPGLREQERLLTSLATLESIKGERRLAIVTGRPRAEAVWFLDRFGVGEIVDDLVCFEDGPLKPDPFPVQRALALLGCERAWMVGDTPDDMVAAERCGVLPIGIIAPGDDHDLMSDALDRSGAACVITQLETLIEWLP
jgi:histidinol-phosphate aminotransferase